MKKLLLVPLLAAIALFVQPVLAEDARQPAAQAAQGGTAGMDEQMSAHENMMQESMKSMNKMQAQMATIHQTKDPKKRQKLLQEHRKSMLDSIKMVRDMMGGMGKGCPMMGGGHMGGGHMGGGHMMGGHMMGGTGCPKMGGAGCPMMGGNPAAQPGSNPDAAPAAQAGQQAAGKTTASPEGKVWTCPMHPNVVRDQPGLCPICGMELVEKGQAGAAQSGQGHMMGCPMMGGAGCPMMGGAGCPMMSGGGCPMMGMAGKHMDMMLMLMEQMIEHDEAAARR